MKINNYHPPKSSFLSINKDMRLIVDKILNMIGFVNYYIILVVMHQKNLN